MYVDLADESMITTYVSPQIEALLGITPRSTSPTRSCGRSTCIRTTARRARGLPGGRESGEPFTFEYRLIARDGRVVWFRDSAVVMPDADGEPGFIQGVMLDITERKEAEEQVAFLAYHDKLTGLPNRAMFDELLGARVARARRHDLGVSVLSMDIDNFKLVNDSLGHEAATD